MIPNSKDFFNFGFGILKHICSLDLRICVNGRKPMTFKLTEYIDYQPEMEKQIWDMYLGFLTLLQGLWSSGFHIWTIN